MSAAEAERAPEAAIAPALGQIDVRVWAELGRASMPAEEAGGLPEGSVVELDREVDDPVDVYADGLLVATGRLVVDDDGGISVRIEALAPDSAPRDEVR